MNFLDITISLLLIVLRNLKDISFELRTSLLLFSVISLFFNCDSRLCFGEITSFERLLRITYQNIKSVSVSLQRFAYIYSPTINVIARFFSNFLGAFNIYLHISIQL